MIADAVGHNVMSAPNWRAWPGSGAVALRDAPMTGIAALRAKTISPCSAEARERRMCRVVGTRVPGCQQLARGRDRCSRARQLANDRRGPGPLSVRNGRTRFARTADFPVGRVWRRSGVRSEAARGGPWLVTRRAGALGAARIPAGTRSNLDRARAALIPWTATGRDRKPWASRPAWTEPRCTARISGAMLGRQRAHGGVAAS